MPIIQTVDLATFCEAFRRMGRASQFQNLEWLYDYLEEYSDSTGEPVELDVIALCCEYAEDTYDSIVDSYPGIDMPDLGDFMEKDDEGLFFHASPTESEKELFAEARREAILDYLRDNTSVCGFDDETVLYAQF